MKIDESCINHNAVNIINDLVSDCYSLIDCKMDEERGFYLMTIGEIKGVIDLANELKKSVEGMKEGEAE